VTVVSTGTQARGRSEGCGAAFCRGRPGACRRVRAGRGVLTGVVLALMLLLSACRDAETALGRGDRLWADSNYVAALAEYRLAYELRAGSDDVLARLAHAYARTAQFERARESYDRLLQRAPHFADQAVFDYLAMARRSQARGDRYGMAMAIEAAMELRPGLPVGDMATPLARYYARSGEQARAQDFFERALGHAPPDSMPDLLFEFAQFQESQGNCREAMELFNAFRTRQPRGERADQARWNVGNCAFQLARDARRAGDPARAVTQLQVMLDLGVPQNLLDQAWFERGEALLELDRPEEALQAYVQALEHIRTQGGGQLAERARQRIDQLRFGRDFVP
jgi:tetratricopeptide (TPR) repeat protein